MERHPEQKAEAGRTNAKRFLTLIRKAIYYASILVAGTIGSYLVHYELSSPRIDLTKQVKTILKLKEHLIGKSARQIKNEMNFMTIILHG